MKTKIANNQKLNQIFKQNNVVFAYLFGSQITGKTGPMSDVDIAVYFDESLNKSQRFNKKLKLEVCLVEILNQEVDVVPLNDAYPLLSHRILKHGKLIYCQDIRKEKEYEDRALGKYLDWQPHLQEQVREVFKE